jgi:mannose-6-phosphate isomerase-like protein (cupin superfamily)
VDPGKTKGWLAGPWNSDLPVSIGFAATGIDDPHVHARVTEVFLVARGTSSLRVGNDTVSLAPRDVVVVDPGEPHTFLSSSDDYLHFVLHIPGLSADEAHPERSPIDRAELGIPSP